VALTMALSISADCLSLPRVRATQLSATLLAVLARRPASAYRAELPFDWPVEIEAVVELG